MSSTGPPSLGSSDSSVSSCSDISVEASFCDRDFTDESSSLEDSSSSSRVLSSDETVDMVTGDIDLIEPAVCNGAAFKAETLGPFAEEPLKPRSSDELDIEFWLAPEPEYVEDDASDSVANYDDDEEEDSTGLASAEPGTLGTQKLKFKKEKIRAMDNVKNGKFKGLVGDLFRSAGVDFLGFYGENWVDKVTSLSWEAACFVKPTDAHERNAMDPEGCVKIKCVATGSPSQSKMIKGLVFKKHAAHKHMPTSYINPRLLLINGSLDLSSDGLSSFKSIHQEKNSLKPIVQMIETDHPNVILVEKSVSRDLQESILAKGMTLIFDMKLHRQQRVACCIGAAVSSSEAAVKGPQLRQCDSFYIEKFVEEHDFITEGGKKPIKTLMFFEGSPNKRACTILLMGDKSEELKRIKHVVRRAVNMAYHLILETSFLLDQSAMFSSIFPAEVIDLAFGKKSSLFDADLEESSVFDVPITDDIDEIRSDNIIEHDSSSSTESCDSVITNPDLSQSSSIERVTNSNLSHFLNSSEVIHGLVASNGINQRGEFHTEVDDGHHHDELKLGYDEDNRVNGEQIHYPKSSGMWDRNDSIEQSMICKNEIGGNMIHRSSESILVVMSTQNSSKGTICEQSHFSHIKFYRSFDVPLGKLLRDHLLNQIYHCEACGESNESHVYHYAHHNKQLNIKVKQLPTSKCLPGDSKGKIWMWGRFSHCTFQENTSTKLTKRVLLSSASENLSFGKFLELSFSNFEHSSRRDFFYFFGLGPMVAMFKYSPVATHSISLPPQKMKLDSNIRGELLKGDFDRVYMNGISMFLDIENILKDLSSRYIGVKLNILGSTKEFRDILLMLKHEKSQFEIALNDEPKGDSAHKLLNVNRARLDLLLEAYVWDRRIHALSSSDFKVIEADSFVSQRVLEELDFTREEENITIEYIDSKTSLRPENDSPLSLEVREFPINRVPIDGNNFVTHDILIEASLDDDSPNNLIESLVSSVESQADKTVTGCNEFSCPYSDRKTDIYLLSDLENDKSWIWAPFAEIRSEYMEVLQRGYLPKIESLGSYGSESSVQKLINDESSRLHIPLGPNKDYIVTDYEDELSSIIACALTLLKDIVTSAQNLIDCTLKERGISSSKLNIGSKSLTRIFSLTSRSDTSDALSFDGIEYLDPSSVSNGADHPEISMGFAKHSSKRKYSVVCLYAREFRKLRDRFCPSEVDFIACLSRYKNWDAKGGKSGSFFAKTLDDRFILKGIKRTELESFVKFASSYFEYMDQCYELGNQTCLAKILGIYQVVIKATNNAKETRHDLLVMENLSFGRTLSRQYDLKGALHARLNTCGNDSGEVLLDQNFVNDVNSSPLYISGQSKRNLQRAVYNDTNFLNSINVMDYSLLVGVDTRRNELSCGIIDYLRQYTWDKQLENWVKSSLVVPKNQLPTIISPIEYKKRFRKFVNTHFLSVPDHWCSRGSAELCGPDGDENASSLRNKSQNRSNRCEDCAHATSLKQGKHEATPFELSSHRGIQQWNHHLVC